MTNLFKKFQTSQEAEVTGILLDYGNNDMDQPIRIRIARAGGSNTKYQKMMTEKAKPLQRSIQLETVEFKELERITKEVYANTVVLDWENVEDIDGVPIQFSVENCLKLFEQLPDLYIDIVQQAQKASLFRQTNMEGAAKN